MIDIVSSTFPSPSLGGEGGVGGKLGRKLCRLYSIWINVIYVETV
jgi:hypothetical protein